jgi:hypothetical protein
MVRLARKSLWTSGQGAGDVGWAEVHRIAGEIALMSPEPDAAKAEAYLERALTVARRQQAKSWELRAAMSMARLWRDQGKVRQARELLTPVYGWFTEGFDTRDLKVKGVNEFARPFVPLWAGRFLEEARRDKAFRRAILITSKRSSGRETVKISVHSPWSVSPPDAMDEKRAHHVMPRARNGFLGTPPHGGSKVHLGNVGFNGPWSDSLGCVSVARSKTEDIMAVPVSFSGVPFYFFSGRKGGPWQSSLIAQSSIVPFAANVTASIEGRDASQFGGLTLTAWRPYTQFVPAPPSGELPAGKAARIRAGSVVTLFEMTGMSASDGAPTTPLLVDAGGYVEISASAYPAPPGVYQGDPGNRFVANIAVTGIAVTGTNWNPNSLGLVLNVVDDELILNLQFGEFIADPPNFANWRPFPAGAFQAGESSTQIAWFPTNPPSLYPPSPDDYPIEFVAGNSAGGSGVLVPGQLFLSPPGLVALWTKPSDAVPTDPAEKSWMAVATVNAYLYALGVENQSFSVLQSLYNGGLVSQSNTVGYSITATTPVLPQGP